MLAADWVHLSILLSLAIIGAILAICAGASLLAGQPEKPGLRSGE
jgi:hypothetical protein